ncbi:MAG: S49 family peptidase [Marinagarivorans sp.]
MPLVHLASRLYGTPLLIARNKLDVILAVLGPRIGLAEMAIPLAQPLLGAQPLPRAATAPPSSSIALLPIHGTLVRRAMGLDALSGLTSYTDIAEQLDSALANPQVKGILLELDSPGGEAGGVFELAARIRAANAIKPVWAHANDTAFSATYALAAAASRVTLSQTAGVGSIGVIALHVDQSIKDARDGLAYNAIFAGHHKNDFSPHAPLSPQAAASLQAEVDRLYALFVDQVALMRSLPPEAVRATEAGLYFGEAAVDNGLADAVSSFEAITAEFSEFVQTPKPLFSGFRAANPIAKTPLESPMTTPTPPQPPAPLTHPAHPTPDPNAALSPPVALPPAQDSLPIAAVAPGSASRSEAQAIAELCLMAGSAHRTAEFLASGLSADQVRHTLLAARASQPDITSHITVDTALKSAPDASPVMGAIKRLLARG